MAVVIYRRDLDIQWHTICTGLSSKLRRKVEPRTFNDKRIQRLQYRSLSGTVVVASRYRGIQRSYVAHNIQTKSDGQWKEVENKGGLGGSAHSESTTKDGMNPDKEDIPSQMIVFEERTDEILIVQEPFELLKESPKCVQAIETFNKYDASDEMDEALIPGPAGKVALLRHSNWAQVAKYINQAMGRAMKKGKLRKGPKHIWAEAQYSNKSLGRIKPRINSSSKGDIQHWEDDEGVIRAIDSSNKDSECVGEDEEEPPEGDYFNVDHSDGLIQLFQDDGTDTDPKSGLAKDEKSGPNFNESSPSTHNSVRGNRDKEVVNIGAES
ncbi:hypothetical protein TorRG33x02_275340 [Trema orientale]|uniref:Uncharacterized protein n=1 Tax=Trema orientale TaxID=63057 RepID=A0A2P5CRZ1_TREOI|nr:hypothetical protein TorRG33x02_275340 [Trema orientale]